jgi:hypothetical protein
LTQNLHQLFDPKCYPDLKIYFEQWLLTFNLCSPVCSLKPAYVDRAAGASFFNEKIFNHEIIYECTSLAIAQKHNLIVVGI